MYIMLGTRGGIAYAVSVPGRPLMNPGPQHTKLVRRRILPYLKRHKGPSLHVQGPPSDAEMIYRCRLGQLSRRSAIDCWIPCSTLGVEQSASNPKRQSVVALSACEAEFIGQTEATKEAIWLRRLLNEPNLSQGKAATIICGDKSA